MKLKNLLSIFILLLLSCSQIDVQLEIQTKGHWSFEDPGKWIVLDTCIVLTSKDFLIDRVWVADIIEEQGGSIYFADWTKVCFTIEGNDYDGFIKELKPKLIERARKER